MVAPTPNYREVGKLLCAYGNSLGNEGDYTGAHQALASALAIAKHEGDLTLEMVALLNAAWVEFDHLHLQESEEKSARALELMEQLNDPLHGWEALFQIARDIYSTGDLEKARRIATRLLALVEPLGVPFFLAHSLYINGKIAALGGDWTTARQFCDRGLLVDPQHPGLLQVRTLLEYAVGNSEQGAAFLERMLAIYRAAGPEPSGWSGIVYVSVPQTIAAVAQMTGTTRYLDIAQAAAQTVLKSKRVTPFFVWLARTSLALIAAQVGDTTTVQQQVRALKGQRGIHFFTMDVDRLMGLLAAASGEWDEAAAYFEAALAIWSKERYPEYARTAYDYADMLLKRGNPGDHERANALLDEALSLSRELGMVPLTERVLLRKEA